MYFLVRNNYLAESTQVCWPQCYMPATVSGYQKNRLRFDMYTMNWYICYKLEVMAKNTSILLGDYFDRFINSQVKTGKYSSASEVVRAALRMFEQQESKKTQLIKELIKGEKSGFVKDFNRDSFLKNLHEKHFK